MRSLAIRLAYGALIVFSALAAFVVVRGLDESGVAGASELIDVRGAGQASGADAAGLLRRVAHEQDASVGFVEADVRDPGTVRHLYLAVGDTDAPEAAWLADGYPWFSRDTTTRVHAAALLAGHDPRGLYLTFGPAGAADALAEQLRAWGFEVTVRDYYEPAAIGQWLINQSLGLSLTVVAMLVSLMVAAGVLTNVKGYGIQRMNGAGFGRMLARDLGSLAPFALAVLVVTAVTLVGCLWCYNRLHQVGFVALVALGCVAVFAAIALAVHVGALGVATASPILAGVKGRMSAAGALVGLYVVRVAALLVALGAVVTFATTWGKVSAYRTSHHAWAQAGDAVYVNFRGTLPPAEQDAMAVRTGRWLIEQERAGQMILTIKQPLEHIEGASLSGDLVVVNSNYLSRHVVRTDDGQRVAHPPPRGVLVLVPHDWAAEDAAATAGVLDWFTGFSRDGGEVAGPVETARGRAGQALFTYGDPTTRSIDPLSDDAVLVVTDADSGVFSADSYMSFASSGGVLLADLDRAVASSEEAGLGAFILGFRPAAQDAADHYAHFLRDLRLQSLSALVAFGVLAATAIGVAQVYTRRAAQRLFATYVLGWTYLRMNARLLAAEAVVALAVVAWSALVTWRGAASARQVGTSLRDPQYVYLLSGWQPAAMGAVATVSLAVLATTVAALTVRHVRTRSSEG